MELQDFKKIWEQYDEKLDSSLKFNAEVIRKMNLDKSKQEMQKPLNYEVLSVIVLFIALAFFGAATIRVSSELKFFLPGLLSTIILIIYLVFAALKVNALSGIDYFTSSVLELQKKIMKVQKRILIFRKIEIALVPVLILTILPLAFKAIHNIDIYKNLKLYVIEVVFILVISLPLIYWINRNWYDKKIKNTTRFLDELKQYETAGHQSSPDETDSETTELKQ